MERSHCLSFDFLALQDPLRTQASGISEGGLGRPMAELDINMDDLLGLNDSPFETVKPDPFRVQPHIFIVINLYRKTYTTIRT